MRRRATAGAALATALVAGCGRGDGGLPFIPRNHFAVVSPAAGDAAPLMAPLGGPPGAVPKGAPHVPLPAGTFVTVLLDPAEGLDASDPRRRLVRVTVTLGDYMGAEGWMARDAVVPAEVAPGADAPKVARAVK